MEAHRGVASRKRAHDAQSEIDLAKRQKMSDNENNFLSDNLGSNTPPFRGFGSGSRPTLGELPAEILVSIIECLMPQPVALGIGTSLWNPRSADWMLYFDRRRDLLNLRCVNKHISALVRPRLFRTVVVSGAWGLCFLLRQLINEPSLGGRIRHLTSAIPLRAPGMTEKCNLAWSHLVSRYISSPNLQPKLARDHPLRRVSNWFEQDARSRHNDPMFPSVVLYAVLCYSNRLEVLNLRLEEPTPTLPRSSMWSWFLEEQHEWVTDSYNIPCRIVTSYPSVEELRQNPCWPPPFLRKVVIEYGTENGGNFITCNTIRHCDSARHRNVVQQLGDSSVKNEILTLFAHRNPKAVIASLPSKEHSTLNNYLDSIGHLEPIRALNIAGYLDNLKYAMYEHQPDPLTPVPADLIAPEINTLLNRLTAPRWPTRLNTTSKALTIHLSAFFFTPSVYLEHTINPANIASLTLYTHPHENTSPANFNTPRPQWHHLLRQATATQRTQSLLEQRLQGILTLITKTQHEQQAKQAEKEAQQQGKHNPPPAISPLSALHLPLRMNSQLTRLVYHRPRGGGGRVRCLRWFDATVREVTLTLEGFLGSREECYGLFYAPVRLPPFLAAVQPGVHHALQGQVDFYKRVERARREAMVRVLVDGLPAGVERLNLVEWFGGYADGEEGVPGGWYEQMELVLIIMEKLAGIFKLVRPSLRRVELTAHVPEEEEADWWRAHAMEDFALWGNWGGMVEEYGAMGIELTVKGFRDMRIEDPERAYDEGLRVGVRQL